MMIRHKNGKKFLGIMLSFILLCSAMPIGFAEEETQLKSEYGNESYELLNALEISEMKEEELVNDVARVKLLAAMARAAGMSAVSAEEPIFADLGTDDADEPYVRALYQAGIIKPDSKGNIYPTGKVQLQEGVAIAMKLTGYAVMAEDHGGYPAGYLKIANRYDMLTGLPKDGTKILTVGMTAKLIENMLKTKVMIQTYQADGGSEYRAEGGDPLLYTVFDVECVDDIVEAVDISQIAGGNETEMDFVIIGGEEIECSNIENIYEFLGYHVNAYYIKGKDSAIARMVTIRKSDQNREVTIDLEDVLDASGTGIKVYTDQNRNAKKYSFKHSLPVIYNGVSTRQSFSKSLIEGKCGTIRLLDNNDDGGYDIILIDAYENFVVSDTIKKDSAVFDKFDVRNSIKLDLDEDDPFVWIYDMSGKKVSFSSVKKNSVLSIFRSAPDAAQGYIRAYVNNEGVNGIISQVRSDNKVVIDGEIYELTEKCAQNCSYYLKPGTAISFKKDFGGKIAYIEGDDSGGEYAMGFIVKVAKLQVVDYELQFKIYTTDDSFIVLKPAERLKIDAKTYKSDDTDAILNVLNKASGAMFNKKAEDGSIATPVPADCYSSLVRYRVDDEGRLSAIDTVLNNETGLQAEREDKTEADDKFFAIYDDAASCKNNMLGSKILYDSSVILISYPSPLDVDPETGSYFEMGNEKLYSVNNAYTALKESESYKIHAFYTDAEKYYVDILGTVYDASVSKGSADYRTALSIVSDGASRIYKSETEEVFDCITVNGGTTIPVKDDFTFTDDDGTLDPDLPVKMTIHDLRKGDIIKYVTDSEGFLSDLQLVFRIDELKRVDTYDMSNSDWHYGSLRCGYVYNKFNGGILLYVPDDIQTSSPAMMSGVKAKDCVLIQTGGSIPFYAYEEQRPGKFKVSPISNDDLKTYKDVGAACSRVIVQRYWTDTKAIIKF